MNDFHGILGGKEQNRDYIKATIHALVLANLFSCSRSRSKLFLLETFHMGVIPDHHVSVQKAAAFF